MDHAELSAFLSENADKMKAAALEAVMAKIKRDLEWNIPEGIQSAVNKFMAEEIAPAVVTALQGQKGEIVKAVVVAASQIGDALAVKMVENATKTLASYSAKELISKLVAGN